VLLDGGDLPPSESEATRRLAALGRLSAGVAHEIRNPLSGIGTNAQVLRRRLEPGDPRERFVDFILEEVRRLDKIIEDLLHFARPPEPRMASHDLRVTVEKVLMMARGQLDEAAVQVELDVEESTPSVFVDSDHIVQVVLNLVLNAIQATREDGRLRIQIGAVDALPGATPRRPPPQATGFVRLAVADNGVGISENDMPKLFEPFFTTRPSGTGLGLSTSRVLVEQHGGTIHVDSTLGLGTTVSVFLPVEKRRAAQDLG
jgi:signal transduction histidine kinase